MVKTRHLPSRFDFGRIFRVSLKLLDDFNNSEVKRLFEANIGREIDAGSIQRAMDQSFSNGAGNRLRIACSQDDSRRIITELTIGLTGELEETTVIEELISDSKFTEPGCPSGIVDAVGTQ